MNQASTVNKYETLIITADEPVVLNRSRLTNLPGEVRNRIYDHVLGAKTLHLLPRYTFVRAANGRGRNHGLYALRLTCRQIASETEHYVFQTVDFSEQANLNRLLADGDLRVREVREQHALLEQMMYGRWQHVRHMIVSSHTIPTRILINDELVPVNLPLPTVLTDEWKVRIWTYQRPPYKRNIYWPSQTCNLTTLTIYHMNPRKVEESETLFKILKSYFPRLVDICCSYTGDDACMMRYRITNDGQVKWWYSGEDVKNPVDEPTAAANSTKNTEFKIYYDFFRVLFTDSVFKE